MYLIIWMCIGTNIEGMRIGTNHDNYFGLINATELVDKLL